MAIPSLAYKTAYLSPLVENVRDAPILLIAEKHLDDIRKINARLIDLLSTPGSVLLVEGIRSLSEVSFDNYAVDLKISPLTKQKLTVFGWDRFHSMTKEPATCLHPDEQSVTEKQTRLARLDQASPEWAALCDEVIEETSRTFPHRTASMICTLKNIQKLQEEKSLHGKVFLIAGYLHLIRREHLPDPRWSIDSLYQALNQLPVAIVYPTLLSRE